MAGLFGRGSRDEEVEVPAEGEAPKISIVLPFGNQKERLETCISHITSQGFKGWELILVDNASTDGSSELFMWLRTKNMTLIQLDERVSLGAAFQKGLKAAKGEFVMCITPDDLLDPRATVAVAACMKNTPADMVVLGCTIYDEDAQTETPLAESLPHVETFPNYPHGVFGWKMAPDMFFDVVGVQTYNKAIRRSLLDKFNIKFTDIEHGCGVNYSLRAAVKAGAIVRVGDPLVQHVVHGSQGNADDESDRPLDTLQAFAGLRVWMDHCDVYDELRFAYQSQLLDVVADKLPSFSDYDAFAQAFDLLTSEKLVAFDLLNVDVDKLEYEATSQVYDALRAAVLADGEDPRGRFLLALLSKQRTHLHEQKVEMAEEVERKSLKGRAKRRIFG